MDPLIAANSSNFDSKSRPGFGPRLKSYLSSGNLFGLGHTTESDQKAEEVAAWPDLDPIFDETTTTCTPKLDRWIFVLRDRLRMHGDIPLSTRYNATLLWLTEQCIKVSKENEQLRQELQEMSVKNQELLRTRLRPSNSLHRPTNSVPDPLSLSWDESQSCAAPKNRSISFSDENTTHSTNLSEPSGIDRMRPATHEAFAAPWLEFQLSSSTPQSGTVIPRKLDALPEQDDSIAANQQTLLPMELWPADEYSEDSASNINTDAQDSAPYLGLSGSGSFRQSASYQNLRSSTGMEKPQAASHRRRKSSASVQVSRRAFSFYPGDDDVLGSLADYSRRHQQLPNDRVLLPTTQSTEEAQNNEHGNNRSSNRRSVSLTRDSSNSSVVTVVKAPKQKGRETKTPPIKAVESLRHDKSKDTNQRNRSVDKAHGPLAAALAATARFGKTAKKTTIRTVPREV